MVSNVRVICPLCSGVNIKKINAKIRDLSNENIKLYHCMGCGVQFLYPQKNEDELKKYYDGIYRRIYVDENYYDRIFIKKYFEKQLPEAQERVERFKNELSFNDEVLEIGCSSGYFLSVISSYVKLACGTEWDNENLDYAKGLGFDVRQNIQEYEGGFDKVFMFHVLEHLNDPVRYVASLKDKINENGKLYIEVPNSDDALLSEYDLQEFKDFYYQLAHLWYFNERSLRYVLAEAGYKNVEIKFIQRYDLSNHLWWLGERKPGGMGKYDTIFSKELNQLYSKELMNAKRSDTLVAICSI